MEFIIYLIKIFVCVYSRYNENLIIMCVTCILNVKARNFDLLIGKTFRLLVRIVVEVFEKKINFIYTRICLLFSTVICNHMRIYSSNFTEGFSRNFHVLVNKSNIEELMKFPFACYNWTQNSFILQKQQTSLFVFHHFSFIIIITNPWRSKYIFFFCTNYTATMRYY